MPDESKKVIRAGLNLLAGLRTEVVGGPFICGIGGVKDQMGLPEYVIICPQYGMSGSAFYKKDGEYSEPGY